MAVEMGFKNLGFLVFATKTENLKSPHFRFLKVFLENLCKSHILDSQLQQKIIAFQSD